MSNPSADLVARLRDAAERGGGYTELAEDCIAEIQRLRNAVERERQRTYSEERISYMGFSYGMGAQWGVDSLRRAINANKHY